MICLGNICRSPMAEGVLQHKLKEYNLDNKVYVDSCGFEQSCLGRQPHRLAIQTAKKHGINIENQRQRLFSVDDFDNFDKIYVMDYGNYRSVKYMARNDEDMNKVDYLLNVVYPGSNQPVPDPYGGVEGNYEHAFQLINTACDGIIEFIKLKNL